jgi:hypothetical protein
MVQEDIETKSQIYDQIIVGYEQSPVREDTRSVETKIEEMSYISADAIPVPPTLEPRLNSMFEKAKKITDLQVPNWDKAFDTYKNIGNITDYEQSGYPKRNFLRNIINGLTDLTYMQNPTLEFTGLDKQSEEQAKVFQTIIEGMLRINSLSNLNLKQTCTKAIFYGHLTNLGVCRLVYQDKKGSLDKVRDDYNVLMNEIQQEEDQERAQRLYAMLENVLSQAMYRGEFGVTLKHVAPNNIYFDPDTTQTDLTDCKFLFEREYIDQDYIKAQYLTYKEVENEDGEIVTTDELVFKYNQEVTYSSEKGNKLNSSIQSAQSMIYDQIMSDENEEQAKIKRENTIPCIWVFDKAMRRVYLYPEGDFSTPFWVWEDELALSRFFHHFVLSFSQDMQSLIQDGEASFYIPYQTEFNIVERQRKLIRKGMFDIIIYDSQAIEEEEVTKILDEALKTDTGAGFKSIKARLKGSSIDAVLRPLIMPGAHSGNFLENRIDEQKVFDQARTTKSMTGGEYRTNTTNKAIEKYEENMNVRSDGMADRIENFIEQILWAVTEIVVSKYTKEDIALYVPQAIAEKFVPTDIQTLHRNFEMSIAAGSMEKPTSNSKRKEAMQILQILGQFGGQLPGTIATIVLKIIKNFVQVGVITDEDFMKLEKELEAQMQRGVSVPQQPAQQAPQQ